MNRFDEISHSIGRRLIPAACVAAVALFCIFPFEARAQEIDRAVHISIDGLRPDAVTLLGPIACPNLHRMMVEGTFTLNARTDFHYTNTLPNHTCQITGRGVLGPDGHGVSFNSDNGGTVEDAHGSYVAGVFDVAHDSGLETALFAGKSKFNIFDRSWNEVNGAPDLTGEDNGRDKIDHYLCLENTPALGDSFVSILRSSMPRYAFLHLRDTDTDGHAYGWMSEEYLEAVVRMDGVVGQVIAALESEPAMAASTVLIVTTDHGGHGTSHSDPADPLNYTIPLFAMGPGIPAGGDMYQRNPVTRLDPGSGRPLYSDPVQPIRNGGSANIALDMLGLGPVPGSTIDSAQDLDLQVPPGTDLPCVEITSPAGGSDHDACDYLIVEVDASAPGGITRVELFRDWVLVGEDTAPPWTFTLSAVPPGSHILAARAHGSAGVASTDRIVVNITTSTGAQTRRSFDSRAIASPNPTGAYSRILLELPLPGPVEISLFDSSGRLVRKSVTPDLTLGHHELELDMSGFAPGIYFFRTASGGRMSSGKIVLVR